MQDKPETVFTDSATQVTAIRLQDTSVILVSGPDNRRFLQGQLSNNMTRLSREQSLRAALCNLKGRVIADMQVLDSDDGILLCTQAGMASVIIGTLEKYRVFFKTSLEDVSHDYTRIGLCGHGAASVLEAAGYTPAQTPDQSAAKARTHITRLPSSTLFETPRFDCLTHKSSGDSALLSMFALNGVEEDETGWRLADIRCGLAHIRPGQQELFTPQLLNYDLNGVIDFKKGCYTGQEVVARMYYRAEAKKRLYHAVLSAEENLPADEVVDSVQVGDKREVLRVMNRADAESGPGITAFY